MPVGQRQFLAKGSTVVKERQVEKKVAQFKRRTFHLPNLIPIWVDPND